VTIRHEHSRPTDVYKLNSPFLECINKVYTAFIGRGIADIFQISAFR